MKVILEDLSSENKTHSILIYLPQYILFPFLFLLLCPTFMPQKAGLSDAHCSVQSFFSMYMCALLCEDHKHM